MSSSQEAFDLLRKLLTDTAPALQIDQAIAAVAAPKNRDSISRLLLLLDDHAPYDELMFSLIHAAEDSDDVTYAEAFIDAIPAMAREAPHWASIVLMRIVNNETARRALASIAQSANADARSALIMLCEAISARSAEFAGRTLPIMIAAKG